MSTGLLSFSSAWLAEDILTLGVMTVGAEAGRLGSHPSSGALTVIVVVSSGGSPTPIQALKRNGII